MLLILPFTCSHFSRFAPSSSGCILVSIYKTILSTRWLNMIIQVNEVLNRTVVDGD